MATQFYISAIFRAIDKMTGPIARMKANVVSLQKVVDRPVKATSIGKEFSKIGAAAGRIEGRLSRLAGTAVTAGAMMGYAFGSTVIAGAEFEQTIINATSKLDQLTDKGGRKEQAFKVLSESALEYGRTTMFSAQQVAAAYSDLAQSGYNRSTMLAVMPTLVKTAAVAESDLAEATKMVSNTMGQFGMEYDKVTKKLLSGDKLSANMQHVSNVLTTTADISRASIKDIYESITESGVIANVTGVSLEKYAAMLATLAQAGISQSIAGTGLKNIFVRLKNPVAAGRKELAAFGIELDKFTDIKDPMEQFGAMFAALDGKSDKVKQGFLDKFFGKIPLAAAMVLFREGPAQVQEFYRQIMDSQGALDSKYGIVSDSMMTRIKKLSGAIMSLGVGVTEGNKSPIEGALEGMTNWINNNSEDIISFFTKLIASAKHLFGFLWEHRETVLTVTKGFIALKAINFAGGTLMDSFTILNGAARLLTLDLGKVTTATTAIEAATKGLGTVGVSNIGLLITAFSRLSLIIGGILAAKALWDIGNGVVDYVRNNSTEARKVDAQLYADSRKSDPIENARRQAITDERFKYIGGQIDSQGNRKVSMENLAAMSGPMGEMARERLRRAGKLPAESPAAAGAAPPVAIPVSRSPKEVFAEVRITVPKGTQAQVIGGAVPGLTVVPQSGGM